MRKFKIFLSYTNREEEIKLIKPFINEHCEILMEWARQKDIEIFYDEYSIKQRQYTENEMKKILSVAISDSDLMIAFLSNGYVSSEWCQFEWAESRLNQYPPIHGILWKRITQDISWLGLLGDAIMPEKLTDVSDQEITPTKETFQEALKICVEGSKEIIMNQIKSR